jgi:hypothetical protein
MAGHARGLRGIRFCDGHSQGSDADKEQHGKEVTAPPTLIDRRPKGDQCKHRDEDRQYYVPRHRQGPLPFMKSTMHGEWRGCVDLDQTWREGWLAL